MAAWKSPAQTLQEWKEQRARERRAFDPLGVRPSPPFNMVRPEGEPGGFPAQQTRYDPLISMQGRTPPPRPLESLIRGRPDSPFPPTGLPGQQSTQSVADVFGAPQEGPGYQFPGMFDQPSSMARPFKRQEAAVAGTAPLIAGPSISDRVRGNRYANMDPRERQALNLTIAGELAPSSYGTPGGDQEVANMVETITTRAAQKGKSIEDTVRQNRQYSPWNTLDDQADMRERFKEHAPDVRRMVSNAVTGEVMPTHEGLTSYHATRMPGTGQKPTWARGIEPSARAGKHSFYTDIAPWSSSPAGPPLPAAPVDRAITSQDLAPPPPAPFSRGAPLSAGAIAGTDLPPPADYAGPPPYTGGPVNAPLATPPALSGGFTPEAGMPASPAEKIQTGLATPQVSDPGLQQALGPRPPLVALAEDRATRERAPLIAPPAGVPQTPLRGPAPMPGVDMGQMPMPAGATPPAPVQSEIVGPPAGPLIDRTLQPPEQQLGPAPLIAPPAPAPAPVQPAPAPAAPVSTMRDVANAARGTGVDYIYRDPSTNILSGFDDKKAWTPEQQAQIAGAVPGIATDAGGLRLTPAARPPLVAPPAAVPSGAPLVTPRRTVTPQTPVSPEPESNLPPMPPPTSVPPIEPVTLGPAAPETAGMGTPAPLIAPATTPINPRLSPREIARRAEDRGFGTVENLTGDRWARGLGAGAGVAAGLATGNPLLAAGLGVQGYRSGDDVRRSYMNRTGPFGLLGNIFGFGRGRGKDKKENDEKYGSLPKKDPSASSLPSSVYGGFGGNRYQGGTYGGQSTGGRYITEGTGGAFR